MRFKKVRIHSSAVVQPPNPLTSEDIEKELAEVYQKLRLPEGRLELMTGIKSRHFWDDHKLASDASAEAGKKLLNSIGIPRDEIGFLAHCAVCRDRLEPATAAYVHSQLGLDPKTLIFDVSNACLGFLNTMTLAGGLIESGQIRYALLVSGENGKPLLNHTIETLKTKQLTRKTIKPYFANLTIGAGAVAMLLCHEDVAPDNSPKLLGGYGMTDSEANKLCQGDNASVGILEMLTEAELLLDAGLKLAKQAWVGFEAELGWSRTDPDQFICHQVGKTHQRKLFEALALDPAKDFVTYPYMGNVGSVSLPFTFHQAKEEGAVKNGDKIALLGIGSGLSTLMLGVEG